MPSPRLIVIVAYGSAADLGRCLGALSADETVVVVDNSSDPGVAGVSRQAGVGYVDPGSNLGFAAAVNLGVTAADWGGSDLLLLNPDAVITSAGIDAMQRELTGATRICCVAPQQRGADGERARISWPFPNPRRLWLEAFGLARVRQREDFIVGSILLIRGDAWRDVGGLDENYFLYGEEADWQRRARARGWQPGRVLDVLAEHTGGGTSSNERRRQQLFHAGQETHIRTWYGDRGWRTYRRAAITGAALRSVLPRTAGQARHRVGIYRGRPRADAGLPPLGPPTKLRIAHLVVTDAFAGTERYVCQVARGQAAAGHLVTVVGGNPEAMTRELGPGIRHYPARTPLSALRSMRRLPHVDVLHTHLTSAELVGLAVVRRLDAAYVSTRHIAKPRGSSAAARLLGRGVTARVELQLAISDFVASRVEPPSTVIRNGTPEVEASYDAGSRTILVAQRLEPEKDTATALRAFAASGLAETGWALVVAGDGVEREQLTALARDLGIAESSTFPGFVTPLGDLLRAAAMVLAPALAEPLGLTVLEAMAHAVPVVAAASGGHLESLGTHPELLFAAGDWAAAGAALRQLADDPASREAIGVALRRRQRSDFSLQGHLDKLSAAYDELLRSRRS